VTTTTPEEDFSWEASTVFYNRYWEARKAGLTMVEAKLFASSSEDIGQLRKLVAKGCPVDTIRRIVL
jgi:hypothetical protein